MLLSCKGLLPASDSLSLVGWCLPCPGFAALIMCLDPTSNPPLHSLLCPAPPATHSFILSSEPNPLVCWGLNATPARTNASKSRSRQATSSSAFGRSVWVMMSCFNSTSVWGGQVMLRSRELRAETGSQPAGTLLAMASSSFKYGQGLRV